MEREPNGRQGGQSFSIVNVVAVVGIVVILAAVLLPAITRRPAPGCSTCQSNLKQIGNSVKMYLSDWDDHYPSNRQMRPDGALRGVCVSVSLSARTQPGETDPPRFQYGVGWVEALYVYAEAANEKEDPQSAWRCPTAEGVYPEGSERAGVSYVFNRNMIEKEEGIIKNAATLMLVRETARLLNSELRPLNDSTWTSKTPPISPFLTEQDRRIGKTECKLHGNGSHILFVDGHVKGFSRTYFPSQKEITKDRCWDPNTKQWYNRYYANPQKAQQRAENMSIAITP